jgi:YfiH family protein
VSTTDETRRTGELPLWEIPGWRERFGVEAGITGRPLDLGFWTREPVGEVMARWRTFRGVFAAFSGMVMAHQVHGNRVLWHPGSPGWTLHEGADGHATASRGLLLLVTVADCVPVYLVAPGHGAVALLHAGWRGTADRILARGIELLQREAAVEPSALVMHLGVAISGPCYEVGAEVVRGIGREPEGTGPWHVDLRAALAEQGREAGVGEITVSGHCTSRERSEFYSHRASGGADGRMVAFLGMPLAPR